MRRFCVVLAVCIAVIFLGCKKEPAVLVLEEYGLELPISQEYVEKGLDFQDMGLMLIVAWSDKPTFLALQEDFYQMVAADMTPALEEEFNKRFSACYQTIACILVLDEEEYASTQEAEESLIDVSDFSEFGRSNGMVYLYATAENDTSGMTKENAARFEECKAQVFSAIQNATFIPLKDAEA